jgi:hypothetical protein
MYFLRNLSFKTYLMRSKLSDAIQELQLSLHQAREEMASRCELYAQQCKEGSDELKCYWVFSACVYPELPISSQNGAVTKARNMGFAEDAQQQQRRALPLPHSYAITRVECLLQLFSLCKARRGPMISSYQTSPPKLQAAQDRDCLIVVSSNKQ